MRSVRIDTLKFLSWLGGKPERETFMMDTVPMSRSSLKSVKAGYQPSELMINRINDLMRQYPEGTPLPTPEKQAVGV